MPGMQSKHIPLRLLYKHKALAKFEDCTLTFVNSYVHMVIYFTAQPEEWAHSIHDANSSNGKRLSPCSFLKSFSDMATGKSSSPTGGWMLTLKQSSLVLKKKHIKAD